MNSYQRLKKKNEELRRQLLMVCMEPESEASRVIIASVKADQKIEDALWLGGEHFKNPDGSKWQGYIHYVNNY